MRVHALGLWLLIGLVAMPSFGAVCARGNRPAATLLAPFFEVDTESASGRTTLVSVGNSSDEPTVAYVTLWTDWSIPILGFFISLNPDEVRTINLRDVLRDLQIPSLDGTDPERFPGCAATSQLPALTAEQLRQRLRGLPDPETGNCFGSDRGESAFAVGFVTIDVATDCVPDLDSPKQWFQEVLAANSNVLFGEIFYVDTDQDSAQGLNMVSVRHDPSLEVDRVNPFYAEPISRVPPDERWRTRVLQGLGVDADTELVIWSGEFGGIYGTDGLTCGYIPHVLEYSYRTGPEAGPLEEEFRKLQLATTTQKVDIETLFPDVEGELNGILEFESWWICTACGVILPESPVRLSTVIWPIIRADGRFSLAVEATPVEGPCLEPTP